MIDYRLTYVNATNGKTPRYYCVRTSLNSRDVKQLCDPTTRPDDGSGQMTGVVRAAVEEFWNELKRLHFLDSTSRTLVITLQLKSNHVGVRYRMTLMFELTALGAILPSYDVETRILSEQSYADMLLYANISLVSVLFFALLEILEMLRIGPIDYASNIWHLMDWVNYLIFFLVYAQVGAVDAALHNPDCSSYVCSTLGYFDDWRLMGEYRTMKQYLSICVCIQLFKITKFTSALVPKMGLMSNVLRTAAVDLFFFGIIFFNSLIAFSCMLYVQLGPVMVDFYDQIPAIVSLFRALFGDFDIDEIMNNSSGYLNAVLFLGYLFVAVFIMLSLFLAILAEAQAAARDKEATQKLEDPTYQEYGVFALGMANCRRAAVVAREGWEARMSRLGGTGTGNKADEEPALPPPKMQTLDEVVTELRGRCSGLSNCTGVYV